MEERHKDEGLVLLAVNLDDPGTRSKIPGFLKKYGIHARVLLGDSKSLNGYDTRIAGAVYVIDRKGFLAGSPAEFYSKLEKTVEERLPDLLAGKPTPGPVLWAIEKTPPGFGLLWRQPGETVANLLAVAPAEKGRAAEIGLLDEGHLRRYSASGELLGEASVETEELQALRGADLDGDGKNEWISGGGGKIVLWDRSGEMYWSYPGIHEPMQIVKVADLDGDGSREILILEGASVVAKRSLPGILWKRAALGAVWSVVPDPLGNLLVQTEEGIQPLDHTGRLCAPVPLPGGGILKGRIDAGNGRTYDVLGPRYYADVDAGHDLDGDGRKDILVSSPGGIQVFSLGGKLILSLRITNNQIGPMPVLENLDGRPGDELVLAIPEYGLVALGISPHAKPVMGSSSPRSLLR